MSRMQSFTEVTKQRISKWIFQAKPIDEVPTWTETRRAIDFGGHTYILGKQQTFQCARCGKYDPEWTETEVVAFMEQFGSKPYDIRVKVTIEDENSVGNNSED